MRPRHQLNSVPGARVYGSPGISQPPMQASNSPNGRSFVDFPRRGDSYGQVSMAESFALSDRKSTTSELQSQSNLVCRLLLEKKKKKQKNNTTLYSMNPR